MRKWWEDFMDVIASIGLFCMGVSAVIVMIMFVVIVVRLMFWGG
jgi:hypothetical protein